MTNRLPFEYAEDDPAPKGPSIWTILALLFTCFAAIAGVHAWKAYQAGDLNEVIETIATTAGAILFLIAWITKPLWFPWSIL